MKLKNTQKFPIVYEGFLAHTVIVDNGNFGGKASTSMTFINEVVGVIKFMLQHLFICTVCQTDGE